MKGERYGQASVIGSATCQAAFVLDESGIGALMLLGELSPAPITASAADIKQVARQDTLVVSDFGSGLTEIQDPQNMNPYSLGGLGRVRDILNKTIFEFLYLYNHNTGEEIPWLAPELHDRSRRHERRRHAAGRREWSDGQPFTSDDVKYTIELLRDTPSLVFAADMKEWVKDVTVTDDQHFTINLNKPNVRFFYIYFVENSEIHIPILPKHIWQGQDPATFTNYDPARRARRSAPARTPWSTPRARRRSSTATTTGGAPRPASSRCPSRCA